MSYPTYYRMQPQSGWPAAKSLRVAAQRLLDAEGRKEKLEAELAFINDAEHVVLLQATHALPETIVELAEEIGEMLGDAPYDGSDPAPAWTWIGECLEMAGIGNAAEQHLFDADDADGMVFVPAETFDTVLHEAEEKLRALLARAQKAIEQELLPAAA